MSTLSTFDTKHEQNIIHLAQSDSIQTCDQKLTGVQIPSLFVRHDAAANQPITGYKAAFKRSCDFVIGGTALLVLMPFLALLAVLIRLDSAGPVLFSQQRHGLHKKIIKVYKFRTMYHEASCPVPTTSSFTQTRKDDPRVTRIGKIMRKASLDELPQLFNVILGSMSLVGPRPHPVPLDEQYKHIIPAFDSRYTVKPGLTGWAQVNGFRGETTHVEDMVARVEHDRHYINHWTLWLDIKIIAITGIKGWIHRNAY